MNFRQVLEEYILSTDAVLHFSNSTKTLRDTQRICYASCRKYASLKGIFLYNRTLSHIFYAQS